MSPRKSRKKSACFSSTRTRARRRGRTAGRPSSRPGRRRRCSRSRIRHRAIAADNRAACCIKASMAQPISAHPAFTTRWSSSARRGSSSRPSRGSGSRPVIGFILVGMLVGPFGLGAMVGRLSLAAATSPSPTPRRSSRSPSSASSCCCSRSGSSCRFQRLWAMRRLVFGVGAAELVGRRAADRRRPASRWAIAWTGAVALGLALALSSTALVLPIAGTHQPGRPRGASRCCCSRIWRSCRSSSCSARWRRARGDGSAALLDDAAGWARW